MDKKREKNKQGNPKSNKKKSSLNNKIILFIYRTGEGKMIYTENLTKDLLSKIAKLECKDRVSENNFIKYYVPYEYEGIIINISNLYSKSRFKSILQKIKPCIDKIPENILNYLKINNFRINIVSPRYLNIYVLKDLFKKDYERLIYDGFIKEGNVIKQVIFRKKVYLSKLIGDYSRTGCFIWGRNEIFLRYSIHIDHFISNELEENFFHELGHYLDYDYKDNISYEDIIDLRSTKNNSFRRCTDVKFLDIYENERVESKLEYYYIENFSEYFAQVFAVHFLVAMGKKKYKKYQMKGSSKYIKEFIDNFNINN